MITIALSSNTAWSLYNFRGGLIRALLARGERVVILAPPDKFSARLAGLGCEVVDLSMDSDGTNPVRDAALVLAYRRFYRHLRPAVALHYTIKPVIYGGLAARMAGVPCVSTITGLGTAFIRDDWLTRLVRGLFRISQRQVAYVFFQNQDDLALFQAYGLAPPDRVERLPGSGVDLSRFQAQPLPVGREVRFLLIARLLWDKGVGEFVEAVRRVRALHPHACFQLLGPIGVANRTAIPRRRVDAWVAEGVVEYLGENDDVRPFIAQAHCVVLPSYREGTPRSLLEAAAMGRPLITADSVGCREVVEDGVNGYLCRVRDAEDLAQKFERFLALDPELWRAMGQAGRAKVEREFDERLVIARYLKVIDGVLGGKRAVPGMSDATAFPSEDNWNKGRFE